MKARKLIKKTKKTTIKLKKGELIRGGDYWLLWIGKLFAREVVGQKFDGIGDLRRPV
jgi:hypothetical protein